MGAARGNESKVMKHFLSCRPGNGGSDDCCVNEAPDGTLVDKHRWPEWEDDVFPGRSRTLVGGCLVGLLPAGSKVVGRWVDSRRRYQPSAATDASLWWENTSYRLAMAPKMARGERVAGIGGEGKGGR